MACKHCGLSDDSLKTPNFDSFPGSCNDLWAIVRNTDAEIARVEALLDRLVLKRVFLKKEINYRSSPLLRIPPDITSEIFEDCSKRERQPGDVSDSEDISRGALISPLLLGSVCSAWRELAWSTPWLWASITLRLHTRILPTSATLLAEWLSRSGQCALTISLTCTSGGTTTNTRNEDILTILAGVSERWRHITFSLPQSYYDILRSVEGRLPLLKSVTAILGDSIPVGHGGDTFRILSAPQLQVAHFSRFWPQSIILPIAQLTTLSGYPCSDIMHCLEVLESALQLVHASFIISSPNWPPESPSPGPGPNPHRVIIPRLQSLEVMVDGNDQFVTTLLDKLNLPDVRELSFRSTMASGWYRWMFRHSSFTSFILRSACPLRSLSIFDCYLHDNDFFQCMQVMPSLAHLVMEQVQDITGQTIRNLTPNTVDDLPLLPSLQTLSISSRTLALDFVELHAMLSARRGRPDSTSERTVAQLKSVSIMGVGPHEASITSGIPLLQQLIEEGMQISVQTDYPDADRVWL